MNNIIHRDLKPENILFVEGGKSHGMGNVKICDFGSAVKYEKNVPLKHFYGSPNYIAPEILTGAGYNEKCDVWSIGVILFTLIMGAVPFDGNSDAEVLNNVMNKPILFEGLGRKSVELTDLMKRLLFKDPDTRFTAMQAINHRICIVRGKDPFIYEKVKQVLFQFK